MKDQKEYSANYFGTLFFMVLFFILMTAFSGKTTFQTSWSSPVTAHVDVDSTPSGAVVEDIVAMPSMEKSCLHLLYNGNINFFSELRKIVADNNSVSRCLLAVEKTGLMIKPLLIFRFFIPHLPSGGEELPSLS